MRITKLTILFLVGLSIFVQSTSGQNYLVSTQSYSISDGLPSRTVQSGLHASDGFIWFGTLHGLSRFDGEDFVTLTEKHGLRSNNIYQVAEDVNGYLWLLFGTGSYSRSGPNGILQLVNPTTMEVLEMDEVYPDLHYPKKEVVQLISDPINNILLLSEAGELFSVKKGELNTIGQFEISSDSRWFSLTTVVKDDAFVWFAPNWQNLLKIDTTGSIVGRLSTNNNEGLKPLRPTKNHDLLFVKYDWHSEIDEKRIVRPEIWRWSDEAAHNTGRLFYTSAEDVPTYSQIESYYGKASVEAVVIKNSKLYLLDDQGRFQILPDIMETLPFELEWRCFTDKYGYLWIGSVTEGVSEISFTKSSFETYLNKTHEFGDPSIWRNSRGTLQDDEGNLWIANLYGLHVIEDSNTESDPELLINEWCFGLEEIGDKIYLGADKVYVFSKDGSLLNEIVPTPDVGFEAMYCFHQLETGTVLVGSENGFKLIDESTGKVVRYDLKGEIDDANKLYVYEIFTSKDQKLWATTSHGILELDHNLNGDFHQYHASSSNQFYLPINEVLTVLEDVDGSFWIGSNGSGLVHWNRETGSHQSFTITDGLAADQICGILKDEGGDLWLSSGSGLMRFEPSSKRISIYTERDGIPHSEFNRISSYQGKDGRLYFGGIDGTIGFRPEDLEKGEQIKAPFKLTSVLKYLPGVEEPLNLTFDYLSSGHIDLNPEDLYSTVSFSLLDFRTGDVHYRYRITDLNQQWVPLEKNNLRLANLPYGKHTLELQAQYTSGEWAEPYLVELVVHAPFYLQTWFIILVMVLVVLLIILYTRIRTKRLEDEKQILEQEVEKRTRKIEKDKNTIEKQAKELLELDQMKSRFFANISHELRTPLTLIIGPLQHALEQQAWNNPSRIKTMIERVSRNGQVLLRLVEQILDLSRLESGKLIITEKPVELNALVRKFKDPFEQLGQSKGVVFEVTFNQIDELTINLDEDKFEKILYNLLSNAFKFTKAGGKVELVVDVSAETIEFAVSDTGAGISAEELLHVFDRFYQSKSAEQTKVSGSGIGLAFAKELSIALGGNLSATSQEGKGSIFTLQLPLTISNTSAPKVEETDKMQTVLALTVRSELKDKTILIVEDNADMRLYIEEVLSEHFKIKTAEDGLAAWEYLQTSGNEIDLVLSDVMMPRMDGFTLLEKVKETESLMLKPFVLLTAKASIESKVKALRIGVDDYLFKPFSTSELLARVCGLLTNLDLRNNSIVEPEDDETVVSLPTFDQNWLSKLEAHCSKNVGNSAYGIADLANEMALSERQLTRNLKKLTGLTPNRYFREIKLHTARERIKSGRFKTLAEVSYHVGFDDPQYFARIYQEHFGTRPF